MLTMCGQLQREEENLCAQRGLVQGQEVQTFSIAANDHLLLQFQKCLQSNGVSFFLLNPVTSNSVINLVSDIFRAMVRLRQPSTA